MNFIQEKDTGSLEKIGGHKQPCQQCRVVRTDNEYDFTMVRGQETVNRALEIAPCGGHNLLMMGPTGIGKTLFARCLPSVLPPLSYQEALETTTIYSLMGQDLSSGLLFQRPIEVLIIQYLTKQLLVVADTLCLVKYRWPIMVFYFWMSCLNLPVKLWKLYVNPWKKDRCIFRVRMLVCLIRVL